MIRSTAPSVSEFAHVSALNGPDLGLRIQLVATAATIMATHMATIGLRKKFFIAGNSRAKRRIHSCAFMAGGAWARIYGQGLRTGHLTLTEYVPFTSCTPPGVR
jgi:hypothetical protein